jgi:hypothetical protein
LLWDTRTGKVTAGPSGPRSGTGLWVGAIAFGPGGTTLTIGDGNGATYLWRITR